MPIPIRAESPQPPVSRVVQLDADLAEQWLGKNPKNRNLSRQVVNAYVNDILAGDWLETGESIKFDWNGNLIDGQHRCAAVVAAAKADPSVSIRTWVLWGLPPEAQNVMDSGKKRTSADSLSLDGMANASFVASAATLLYRIENDMFFGDRTGTAVTTSQKRDWLAAYPEFEEFISTHNHRMRAILAPPSVTAAALWMMQARDREAAEEFLTALHTLANLPGDHPVMVLHKKLTDIRTKRQKVSHKEYLAFFFQTWNLVRTGRSKNRFIQPANGWTAKNFPWPR